MKLNYEIRWTLIRLPILPWLKITKLEPEVEIRKVMVEVPVPTPEPVEEPTPKAIDYPDTINYPKVRKSPVYNLDKGKFRHTGRMAGTEIYQLHSIRQDLIKFFIDTDNKPLRLKEIIEHEESPFRHPFMKCNPDCTCRIASEALIRKALDNSTYLIEDLEKMFGTKTVFVMEELTYSQKWIEKNGGIGQSVHFNAWRLSDEAYFIQLNKRGLGDYLQEKPKELTRIVDEKINPPKKKVPGWRKEAMDRRHY